MAYPIFICTSGISPTGLSWQSLSLASMSAPRTAHLSASCAFIMTDEE